MRAALARHTLEVNDNGFMPEGSPSEGYDASRVPGAYPLERVFLLADLASRCDPVNLQKFIAALGDDSEPIRWWAAQGCAILREKSATAEAALRLRLEDKSGAVRVAAAEALASMGQTTIVLPVLERCLRDEEAPWFALQAANVFDRLGEKARPSLSALKEALAAAEKIQERRGQPLNA